MDEETDPREVKRVIEQFLSEMARKNSSTPPFSKCSSA